MTTTSATNCLLIGKMRLIQTVLQPVHIGLSRQFQRSQVIKTTSYLHLVLIETSNREHVSNILRRGRLYSASASSEAVETKKVRGRVSKDVRKSMVENYVNKYRKTNGGKFPTVSEAKKNVGGCYYVVREILQELKYNSRTSSDSSTDTNNKEKIDIAISAKTGRLITPISNVDIVDSSSERSKPDERPRSSILVETYGSKDIGSQSHHPIDERKTSHHFDSENIKQQYIDEDEPKFHGPQSKVESQDSTKVFESEAPKAPTQDADHKTESSAWQNLKSFANGILSIWKRY